jgi:hypothetical protein
MHLEGPWLSTTGKRKGKQKFASAEHARKARELDSEWKDLQKRWGIEAEEKKRTRALKAPPLTGYNLGVPVERSTRQYKSVDTGGNAALAPAKVYTGSDMIGIGQLHKSNAIPIFKKSDAEDLAKMRR